MRKKICSIGVFCLILITIILNGFVSDGFKEVKIFADTWTLLTIFFCVRWLLKQKLFLRSADAFFKKARSKMVLIVVLGFLLAISSEYDKFWEKIFGISLNSKVFYGFASSTVVVIVFMLFGSRKQFEFFVVRSQLIRFNDVFSILIDGKLKRVAVKKLKRSCVSLIDEDGQEHRVTNQFFTEQRHNMHRPLLPIISYPVAIEFGAGKSRKNRSFMLDLLSKFLKSRSTLGLPKCEVHFEWMFCWQGFRKKAELIVELWDQIEKNDIGMREFDLTIQLVDHLEEHSSVEVLNKEKLGYSGVIAETFCGSVDCRHLLNGKKQSLGREAYEEKDSDTVYSVAVVCFCECIKGNVRLGD